jgi:hypothetical protein
MLVATTAVAQTVPVVPSLSELSEPAAPAASVPATAPAAAPLTTASTPATTTAPAAFAVPEQTASVGSFGQSIMYLPEDIANMTRILQAYEGVQKGTTKSVAGAGTGNEDDILSELLAGVTGEAGETGTDGEPVIATMPDLYLSSIVYRGPGNWAVWINQRRFTSKDKHEEGVPQPISIRGISRDMITLGWIPTDIERAKTLWEQRKTLKDSVFRHRAAQYASIDFNDKEGMFLIAMRPNQTFSPENMDVMEGRAVVAVPVAAEPVEAVDDAVQAPESIIPTEQDSMSAQERALAEELMQSIRKIQKFTPVRDTPDAVPAASDDHSHDTELVPEDNSGHDHDH